MINFYRSHATKFRGRFRLNISSRKTDLTINEFDEYAGMLMQFKSAASSLSLT